MISESNGGQLLSLRWLIVSYSGEPVPKRLTLQVERRIGAEAGIVSGGIAQVYEDMGNPLVIPEDPQRLSPVPSCFYLHVSRLVCLDL